MFDVIRLAGLDDSQATVFLAILGLGYGVGGWRLIRYLVALNGVGLGVWAAMKTPGEGPMPIVTGFVIGAALAYLSWRYYRYAVIAMTGGMVCALCATMLSTMEVPTAVSALVCAGLALFVVAMSFTFFPETAAVLTATEGGWLVALAFLVARSQSGGMWAEATAGSPMLLVFCVPVVAMLVAIQLTDMRRTGPTPAA